MEFYFVDSWENKWNFTIKCSLICLQSLKEKIIAKVTCMGIVWWNVVLPAEPDVSDEVRKLDWCSWTFDNIKFSFLSSCQSSSGWSGHT